MNNKIIRTALALLFVSLLLTAPRAQQPAPPVTTQQSPEDRIALYQALLDLTNPWTVMCIAAHPDDEDGTSLIVMRRKYGAHTVSLFSTFGEGGQNAIGPELYEEMGAIRARETMAAAEIQGSEPYFLGLKDFGYSKSADEAFKFWGHDEALRRMVLQIRRLRPDVIITNHSATSNDHGHHQATARLVVEAFDAAADPKRFPEQLNDVVSVWQVQRIFVRARGNAAQNPDRQGGGEQVVTIDPNEKDPVRGTMFAEQALSALQKHATQGPWPKTFAEFTARFRAFSGQNAAPGQLPSIRYRLVREAKGAEPLPKESHNFLDGLHLRENVAKQLAPPLVDGNPLTDFVDQREQVLNALLEAERRIKVGDVDPNNRYRLTIREERLGKAFAIASGVTIKLVPSSDPVTVQSLFKFKVELSNSGAREIQLDRLRLTVDLPDGRPKVTGDLPDDGPARYPVPVALLNTNLAPGRVFNRQIEAATGIAEMSIPHKEHLYDGRFRGYMFAGYLVVKIEGVPFEIKVDTSVDVAPAVEIASINPSPLIVRPDEVGVSSAGADVFPAKLPELRIQLINYLDQRFNGEVLVGLKNQRAQTRRKVELLPHQIATLALPMPSPGKSTAAHPRPSAPAEALSITVRATNSRENITTREVPIVRANAHVARNLLVGYVRGFDFSLPNALAALGVESKELTVDEVKTADLSKYTSIIVDNRVYESQPELIASNQKLLDYANAGGTMIVFYHKSDEWNPDARRNRPQLAPYKLILGNERITDENAPITFIEPEHPLLNFPNKMGPEDFANWIQERGLYYPKDWDAQFHALLQSNDPGETPLKGGLLVADYGRGHYIYTSMVWYRELRAGVPGAYRMLANMISYGQAEGKSKK